jgi:hypothetical protein
LPDNNRTIRDCRRGQSVACESDRVARDIAPFGRRRLHHHGRQRPGCPEPWRAGIHRSVLFVMPETSFFDAVPKVARSVILIMVVSITVTVLALEIAGVSAGRALSDAVSVWTTGLVDPAPYGRANAGPVADVILAIGLAGGALGLAVALPLRERRVLQAFTDPEIAGVRTPCRNIHSDGNRIRAQFLNLSAGRFQRLRRLDCHWAAQRHGRKCPCRCSCCQH